ncbi:MAG: prepilin-type N-terminal cleavage/methylation domain-containing protein [Lentisphaeria bacterium]|nr:prepilin-type N-terminal cleavage/methylation domain-containing protein [Lentisphaeria bacterium]
MAHKLTTSSANTGKHTAMRGFSSLRGERKLYSFTLIELLVVIAIIAILASILMPALSSARERAKTSGCNNNLKSFGNWCHAYADNYGGVMFSAQNPSRGFGMTDNQRWTRIDANPFYFGCKVSWQTFVKTALCPADSDPYDGGTESYKVDSSYGFNGSWSPGDQKRGISSKMLSKIKRPSDVCMMADTAKEQGATDQAPYCITWDSSYRKYLYSDTLVNQNRVRHNGAPNVLYVDGHVAPTHKGSYWNSSGKTGQRDWVIFWYYENSKKI